MTEPTELLACPFCGGTPTTIERPDNIDGTQFFYAIACYCGRHSACAHKMAVRKTPEIAKADAVAAWNTRTPQPTRAQAGAGQPVAWLNPWRADQVTTDYDAYGKHGIPLYTAPQPVVRKPLTDEQVEALITTVHFREGYELKASVRTCLAWYRLGLRDGERAHGIKGGKHGAE